MIVRRMLFAAALTLSLATVARAEAPKAGPVAGIAPGVVDGPTARKLVASGVKVVDVRTPKEFAEGHVPGALNIPHDQMAARASELGSPTTPVMLYCKSGRRTQIAMDTLKAKGFTTLYDLQSYEKWVETEQKK